MRKLKDSTRKDAFILPSSSFSFSIFSIPYFGNPYSPPVERRLFTLFPTISLMMVMVSPAASC
jgi:hypothetical protein